jgi:N-methylhydantoinase A
MARGVLRLAEVNLENALKLVSLNKGYDPRDFALVAYGGGGPLHAGALARALRIPEVIVPANAAVFSAWGMLLADLRRDYARTANLRLENAAPADVAGLFDELEAEARADFGDAALPRHRLVLRRAADMRYRGQEHTVKVDLPDGAIGGEAIAGWAERFRDAYDRVYGVRLDLPADAVTLHVTALGIMTRPEPRPLEKSGANIASALTGRRKLDLDASSACDAAIYDRGRLEPGMRFPGPAVVEERGAAIIVWPGQEAVVDAFGNLLISTGG